jgi:glycosyltransferase involved in cell wall biosynthesis
MLQDRSDRGDDLPIECLVFSKDRPLQLDATLSSLTLNCPDLDLVRVNVLYTTSSAVFETQYRTVMADHPRAVMRRERDFKADLAELAASARYLLFVVDDTLFVGDVSLAAAVAVLDADATCIGVSYRLGRNTAYCYTLDRPQRLPEFRPVGGGLVGFDWPGADHDFGYPLEVSCSLYRASDLAPMLSSMDYRNPNTLEAALARRAKDFAAIRPRLACPEQSVAFSVPANLVQTAWRNRISASPELTAKSLAREFARGRRLDVAHYRGHVANAAHQELPFVYTRRADIPAVSVVIPCYNQAEWLPDAVESVVGQTFADWEIVVVDDGSTDATSEVATGLMQSHGDRRIRLVRQENGGLPAARNTGIANARGRYILPLDADDEIAPEMLARCVALLESQESIAIAYTDVQRFGDEHDLTRAPDFDPIGLPIDNQLSYCSLYRREVWDDVGGYNTNMVPGYEDWDFWIGSVERGYCARRIPEALFRYRIRQDSMFQRALDHDLELRRMIRANHPRLYRVSSRLARWCHIKAKGWSARFSARAA